jgi:hypothetical protein
MCGAKFDVRSASVGRGRPPRVAKYCSVKCAATARNRQRAEAAERYFMREPTPDYVGCHDNGALLAALIREHGPEGRPDIHPVLSVDGVAARRAARLRSRA